MNAQHTPHITETEAYWRAEAATYRWRAGADRRRPTGSIESIRINEDLAKHCDEQADAIAKADRGSNA